MVEEVRLCNIKTPLSVSFSCILRFLSPSSTSKSSQSLPMSDGHNVVIIMVNIIILVIIIIRFMFKMPRIVPDQYFIIAMFTTIIINIFMRNNIKLILNTPISHLTFQFSSDCYSNCRALCQTNVRSLTARISSRSTAGRRRWVF